MSARVTLRLSPDGHGELKRRARQGQSLAAFIRHRLAAGGANRGRCIKHATSAGQARHHERNCMSASLITRSHPGDGGLTSGGRADICRARPCAEEVYSTLQAMGVSRQAGIRRLIAAAVRPSISASFGGHPCL